MEWTLKSRNPLYSKPPKSFKELPCSHKVVQAAASATAGGSLLILSGLIMATAAIGLTVATPLFVIFSPVLIPAAIVVALLIAGFLASGGFLVAAMVVLSWSYRYMAGKRLDTGYRPESGEGLPHKGQYRFGGKGREV